MRKLIGVFVLIGFSLNCFAVPAVGDKAVYTFTQARDTGTLTKTVISINSSKGKMNINWNEQFQGRSYISNTTENLLMDEVRIAAASTVDACANLSNQRPGSFAVLENLQIGNSVIQTCHVHSEHDQQDWWYGDVPFGLVKKEIRKDDIFSRMTSELTSFDKF